MGKTDCSKIQIVKDITAGFPHSRTAVLLLAFIYSDSQKPTRETNFLCTNRKNRKLGWFVDFRDSLLVEWPYQDT